MQKRRLGKTDIYVSPIGLGTVKFGRNQGVKYPHSFILPTDIEVESLLACAADLGINFIDTAPAYGSSEERLGKLLKRERQDWVITTKVGEDFIAGESYFNFSPLAIEQSIERSLKRLQTDYIDVLLVHSNGQDQALIEEENVFSVLKAMKQAGKIRAYGMSTKTVAGGLLTIDMADVAMVTYNPAYTDEREVITHAHQQQKGILVKKAFASGHFNQATKSDPVLDSLQFIFAEPGVSSVVIGSINEKHLRENVMKAEKAL